MSENPTVHPINQAHLAQHPAGYLASLGSRDFSKMSGTQRTIAWDLWKAGPPPSQLDKVHAENEAGGLARIAAGGDAVVDAEGRITPPMSATDRLKLHDAGGVAPKRARPAPGLSRENLPPEFRGLMGAKLSEALSRVEAADVAKGKLASNQFISDIERRRLADTVALGAGGSVGR